MNECGQEWIKKAKRCHSDSDAIHDQRAHKVLHDDPATASSNPQSFDQLREIASD